MATLLLAAAVIASDGVQADDDGVLSWIVQAISLNEDGDVIPASALRTPPVGTSITTGQRISTSAGQHIVLANGRDLLAVQPNTTVTIGDDDALTKTGNLDLLSGTIHVEVGKRSPGQTFSVGARYLVVTVKGTAFDVSTSGDASAVSVSEGVVAAASVVSGDSVEVREGYTAIVKDGAASAPLVGPTPVGGAAGAVAPDGGTESASAQSGDSAPDGSASGGGTSSGSDVGSAVGGASGAIGGAIGGTAGGIGDSIGGSGGGAVSGVGGAVGNAVGGLGGALGGALGDGSK